MKRFIVLASCLLTALSITVFSYSEKELDCAKKLYGLGLFRGSGDTFSAESIDLDSNATRAQIAITVTRMLGKEQKAEYQKNAHPFTDVPSWASDHIGYLYESYLINGISDSKFGSNDVASVQQFATMLLRVLGYSDDNGKDFNYTTAKDFALKVGLIDNEIFAKENLRRGDMVKMCYTALNKPIKDSFRTLAVKLMRERIFTEDMAKEAGLEVPNMLQSAYGDIPVNLPSFTANRISQSTFILNLDDYIEHYGIRVFLIRGNGGVMKEVPYRESFGYKMTKGEISYLNGGGAGYINSIIIDVPSTSEAYSFLILKTTGEGDIYKISGKSPVTSIREVQE